MPVAPTTRPCCTPHRRRRYPPVSDECVRMLCLHGADPNLPVPRETCFESSVSCLAYAAMSKELSKVQLLLKYGANVNPRANYTMLHFMALTLGRGQNRWAAGDVEILRLLLSRGVSLEAKDHKARTARATAEAVAAIGEQTDTVGLILLRDVRLAGGWDRYVLEPRKALLVLREACTRGRATPAPEGVFVRLFAASFPAPLVWSVLTYWRTDRDARQSLRVMSLLSCSDSAMCTLIKRARDKTKRAKDAAPRPQNSDWARRRDIRLPKKNHRGRTSRVKRRTPPLTPPRRAPPRAPARVPRRPRPRPRRGCPRAAP